MPSRLLYNIALPDGAQTRQQETLANQISASGTLGAGRPAVEAISSDAEQHRLTGQLMGRFAQLTASELDELFSASSIEVVPYFARGTNRTPKDGYYTLEDNTAGPATPQDDRVQEFDGTLTKIGTIRSHWRALYTNPTQIDNPFGSGSAEEVGIPRRATKTRWFDQEDGTLEDATPVRTEEGEHDRIDVYDVTDSSIDTPILVYRVPYRHEWPVDVRVWDDRNTDKVYEQDAEGGATVGSASVGSATVGPSPTTTVAWQRVFVTDHDYEGLPVLENDLLRLVFDEDGQRLRAHEWDTADNRYDRVQLGTSSWRLWDVDVTRIDVERIGAQVEFENTSNPGTRHNLNLSLKRGWDTVLFANPDNEGSVPQGLIDRLDPIAATTQQDPAAAADVILRKDADL